MKKKVSLTAALIHRPNLLILDEPLEGIDPVSARQIKDNLRLMTERGITILMSSHVLDTVEKLCDEIAIINRGKRVLQAPTDDLRQRVKSSLNGEAGSSLEELFIDTVAGDDKGEGEGPRTLSWLE